jgi:hypothetical protein
MGRPFTLVFGLPSGDELRITDTLYPGMHLNDPRTSIELRGKDLGRRQHQAAGGCAVSISSIPPAGPLRGTFACGATPYRGGSGTSGFFDASSSSGVLLMGTERGFVEGALVEPSASVPADPSQLDLVYEVPEGPWVGSKHSDSPLMRVEIEGSLRPDGTVADPHLTIAGWLVDAPTVVDGCQVAVEPSTGDVAQGSLRCPLDTDVSDMPLEGTFTFRR